MSTWNKKADERQLEFRIIFEFLNRKKIYTYFNDEDVKKIKKNIFLKGEKIFEFFQMYVNNLKRNLISWLNLKNEKMLAG